MDSKTGLIWTCLACISLSATKTTFLFGPKPLKVQPPGQIKKAGEIARSLKFLQGYIP